MGTEFDIDKVINDLNEGKVDEYINPAFENREIAHEISINQIKEKFEDLGVIKEIKKQIVYYYGKQDLAEKILSFQPLYYDTTKNWWAWIEEEYKWKIIDEVDIMNFVDSLADINTVNSKEKNEILEALKKASRLKKPREIEPTWIQFKHEIFDIKTGEKFMATPDWFVTNPIPYKLNKENFEDTPIMDKIIEEWVGKENVKTLYQIMAYCLIPSYPLSRIFCFIGSGMNGKSCFLNLIEKFVGNDNVCSTELDTLLNSRFEITRLHKKLVCLMGETNFSEMKKTSILKKLTGNDLIGFEYKGKNPFHEKNYAKILIATNNLPNTNDKSIGFYRRWLIIDFPNQFYEKIDILSTIPDEEFESLALKCTIILKDLLNKREFSNEGSIDDKRIKFEEKSDFFSKFLDISIEEDINGFIIKSDFIKKFNSWAKENRHREMSDTSIGLKMKERGYETIKKEFDWMNDGKGGQTRVWTGIKWKE